MEFDVQGPLYNTAARCEPILRNLPDWFGIESAVTRYVEEIDGLPTFLAQACPPDEPETLGFLTIKQHNPHAAEIYVMGVAPEAHRSGVGRSLLEAAEDNLREMGVEYLQVKTLGPSHPDEYYRRTRSFYLAMDFRPLEELSQVWNAENPCLIMVKKLD